MKIFLSLIYLFASTGFAQKPKGYLSYGLGDGIEINRVLVTDAEHAKGLSGIKPSEFKETEGALFFFKKTGMRNFWMPNTYFDLDIIYLNEDFKILSIDRGVKHHPSRSEPIPRATPTISRHVLEIKSGTALSKILKPGLILKWKGSGLPEQKE